MCGTKDRTPSRDPTAKTYRRHNAACDATDSRDPARKSNRLQAFRKRWFDGAFLWRERPTRVKPFAEMSFRNALAVPTKGWVFENHCAGQNRSFDGALRIPSSL